jgi:hypothetical protein
VVGNLIGDPWQEVNYLPLTPGNLNFRGSFFIIKYKVIIHHNRAHRVSCRASLSHGEAMVIPPVKKTLGWFSNCEQIHFIVNNLPEGMGSAEGENCHFSSVFIFSNVRVGATYMTSSGIISFSKCDE